MAKFTKVYPTILVSGIYTLAVLLFLKPSLIGFVDFGMRQVFLDGRSLSASEPGTSEADGPLRTKHYGDRAATNRKPEGEVDPATNISTPSWVNDDGVLNPMAIKTLGLEESQTKAVQSKLGNFWKNMIGVMAGRAVYDEQASDPSAGRDVYRIPALDDRGKYYRTELERDLAEEAGNKAAKSITDNLGLAPFGAFGRYDLTLIFTPNRALEELTGENDISSVSMTYTDPNTGKVLFRSTRSTEKFSKIFGDWKTADSVR